MDLWKEWEMKNWHREQTPRKWRGKQISLRMRRTGKQSYTGLLIPLCFVTLWIRQPVIGPPFPIILIFRDWGHDPLAPLLLCHCLNPVSFFTILPPSSWSSRSLPKDRQVYCLPQVVSGLSLVCGRDHISEAERLLTSFFLHSTHQSEMVIFFYI